MPSHWHAANRLRGRPGERQRKRRLQMHPLCAECQKLGRITPTDEIDHIIPLAIGGTDTDENTRNLCDEHNLKRTAEQFDLKSPVPAIGQDGWPIE